MGIGLGVQDDFQCFRFGGAREYIVGIYDVIQFERMTDELVGVNFVLRDHFEQGAEGVGIHQAHAD